MSAGMYMVGVVVNRSNGGDEPGTDLGLLLACAHVVVVRALELLVRSPDLSGAVHTPSDQAVHGMAWRDLPPCWPAPGAS